MSELIKRNFPRFQNLIRQFPAVAILGARQCGKTTFAKSFFSDWRYLDMEKPSDLVKISEDPEAALHRWGDHIIIDEAQAYPALFPILRNIIDETRSKKGRFLLLGSASPQLIQNVSESLAGRIGFLEFTPFYFLEVDSWKQLWWRGGFPDAFLERREESRFEWFEAYIKTFIERDLRNLGLDISPPQMRKLFSMLAHTHGGIWNASELGASLGVSYHTINRYADILEQTYLIRKLPPYFTNIGKRLVKSSKVYLRDSGLLHFFLGLRNHEELEGHPKRGASWEGFAIEQIQALNISQGLGLELYYWRTASQSEVDLILKKGTRLIPVEIKLHSSPQKKDVPGLNVCMKELNLKQAYVIRPSGEDYTLGNGITVTSLKNFSDYLMDS